MSVDEGRAGSSKHNQTTSRSQCHSHGKCRKKQHLYELSQPKKQLQLRGYISMNYTALKKQYNKRCTRCKHSFQRSIKSTSISNAGNTSPAARPLTSGLLAGLCGCVTTGGNSVRYVGSWSWSFRRMVRAPYSSFGDASQHGTTL